MNTAPSPELPAAALAKAEPVRIAGFRMQLLVAMMLVVSAVTALALYYADHNLTTNVERDLRRGFLAELDALHSVQEIRRARLVERCNALALKPRIHAALEDNALDLLYPSAETELRDVMVPDAQAASEPMASALRAVFYRFLDGQGAVIPPPPTRLVGPLTPADAAQLTLQQLPAQAQLGYLARRANDGGVAMAEVIAMPITSTETGEKIAALVLGFRPVELGGARPGLGLRSGIWLDGRLHMPVLGEAARTALASEVTRVLGIPGRPDEPLRIEVDGAPHLLFYNRLNPDSVFPPAYEVCIYPLAELLARQRQLRWQALGAGALLLFAGLVTSNFLSRRLSRPVEMLAVDSEENRIQRARAEAALEATNVELQRSARFSADASHQLKTPVTVLRAGLEELLAQEQLTPAMREELAGLVHQTFRLSSVIDDLLLLSRVDAGRLTLDLVPVDLRHLIDTALDDLSAQPDAPELEVETDLPPELRIAGDKRYAALILQNLLENARKYNRAGGRVRVAATETAGVVRLVVGNTGQPIPFAAQAHIFERFHRGAMGENVPGYGLGLNLARELARLHHGDLTLARSDGDWTEFEVTFRAARPGLDSPPASA